MDRLLNDRAIDQHLLDCLLILLATFVLDSGSQRWLGSGILHHLSRFLLLTCGVGLSVGDKARVAGVLVERDRLLLNDLVSIGIGSLEHGSVSVHAVIYCLILSQEEAAVA